MNYREKRFVAALLEIAAEHFCNHRCNDLPKEVMDILSPLDKKYLALAWYVWQGDEQADPNYFSNVDWLWLQFFADLLRQEADVEEKILQGGR
jgi:hypothetical protein